MGTFRLFARKCWVCDKDLPFDKHGRGRNRRTCSPACRQKLYRQTIKARAESPECDEKGPLRNDTGPEGQG